MKKLIEKIEAIEKEIAAEIAKGKATLHLLGAKTKAREMITALNRHEAEKAKTQPTAPAA